MKFPLSIYGFTERVPFNSRLRTTRRTPTSHHQSKYRRVMRLVEFNCHSVGASLVVDIAYDKNEAEVFDGDAEAYEVVVQLVKTHDELSPLPYKEIQQ
ncbi:hypothetical protein [Anabaena azotica]|uniref:hypothetical protein n=1 Tax=Anabaena azotica TaxID=197653 RepID=UPI001F54CB87|nr:hypothetical protein [Anabaena azotica]